MKNTKRIVLGILFPFILLITVTSISKALREDEKGFKIQPQKSVKSDTPINNSSAAPVTLTKYSSK